MSTEAPRLASGQLSTIDCVAQSLAVGPVFSGALLGGILAGLSGGVGSFVIVVTTIGMLALGRIVSEFAKRYSGTGTVYEFVARSLGKRAAVFATARLRRWPAPASPSSAVCWPTASSTTISASTCRGGCGRSSSLRSSSA
jgi:amino acid transporter